MSDQAHRRAEPNAAFSPREGWIVLATCWVVLCLLKRETLDSPPYFETAMGIYREAIYLIEHRFDYHHLRFHEPWGNIGGGFCYMISVIPTLVALLIQWLPSPRAVFLVGHLLWYGFAALMGTGLYASFRAGLGPWGSLVLMAACLSTPLAMVQIETMTLDVPMVAALVWTARFVSQRKPGWAAAASACSFLMKPTGLLATLGTVGWLFLGGFPGGESLPAAERSKWHRGLLINSVLLVLEVGIFAGSGLWHRLRDIAFEDSYLRNAWILFPDLVLLLGLATGASLVGAGAWWLVVTGHSHLPGPLASLVRLARQWPLLVYAPLVILASFLAIRFAARVLVIRYLLPSVPLVYLWLFELARAGGIPPRVIVAAGGLLLAVNAWNADGRLFPELTHMRRHCATLERSREYWADHQSNLRAMRELESQARGRPVVLGHPYTYFAAFPELGYVSRPLSGYTLKPFVVRGFQDVFQLFDDLPPEIVLSFAENHAYATAPVRIPLPFPGDEVIYNDELPAPLVIYAPRLGTNPEERMAWLVDNLLDEPVARPQWKQRVLIRAQQLVVRQHAAWAARLLRASLARDRASPSLRLAMAQTSLALNDPQAALDACQVIIEASPGALSTADEPRLRYPALGLAYYWAGQALAAQNRWGEATQSFHEAVRLMPDNGDAADWLARAQSLGND